ncbi:MAG: AAA family ATPase [Thermoanaerobaculia bacterium]|nr:AAA family ATPase [Thermoanaerobaculia bacterium]
MGLPSPLEIARELDERVVGQPDVVREMSVALAKKLADVQVGNILLIGSSGSGKTTLMRAVERYLAKHEEVAGRSTSVRVHANVLAEDAERGHPGERLLHRVLNRARQDCGLEAPVEELVERSSRALVFVDEVDKIRANVGGQVHTAGIRAQEALLTLIENEAVQLQLPEWAGGRITEIDSRGILFVCAGAFEGLYDSVYDRVTVGEDRGALKPVTVVDGGQVHEETPFSLRDWLHVEDLFDYGMSPQFLSRFDATVLLNDLGVDDLVKIFLESPDLGFHQAREYFASQSVELAISPGAVRRIAEAAAANPRMGARALKEVFRRVIRDYEFDPSVIESGGGRTLMIDVPEVEAALVHHPSTAAAARR